MKPFLMFCMARTGSTTLMRILNEHPEIDCMDEPFNMDCHAEYAERLHDPGCVTTLIRDIFRDYNGIKHVAGPKGWPIIRRGVDGKAINRQILISNDYSLVLLTRSNLLQRALSVEIAQQTGVWHYWQPADRERALGHKFQPINANALCRRLVEDREFLKECQDLARQRQDGCFELTYEHLFAPEVSVSRQMALLNDLLTYLGVNGFMPDAIPSIEAMLDRDTCLTSSNSRNLYARIPNFQLLLEEEFDSTDKVL